MLAPSEDILACQFTKWYPILKEKSIKSLTLELPDSFIEYLGEDGIVLPVSGNNPIEIDDRSPNFKSFRALENSIKSSIDTLGGEVFIKLNWSAPIDALWMNCGSAKCRNLEEVFLLLKSSDRIMFDIDRMFEKCIENSAAPKINYHLVIRKWANLNPAMEFRLFVYNKNLVGICQRECSAYYDFLKGEKERLFPIILEFFDEFIEDKPLLLSYTMDIYIDKKERVWVIDINPFGYPTSPLMFEWNELINIIDDIDFRVVENEHEKYTSTAGVSRGPIDVHMSQDFHKFMDIIKAQQNETNSDDEN